MIHILQLLCPSRHCIIGGAFDPDMQSFEEAKAAAQKQLTDMHANPWCGICGSRDLHFEEGKTKFKTLEEAIPALADNHLEQLLSRALLESEGRTYDSQRAGKN